VVSISSISEIGSLLGDPARVNMMIALLDGRARTARELADAGGVSPQTASSHLAKLVAAAMISVERQGRHHYHRIASLEVAQLLEQMHVAAGSLVSGRQRTLGPRDPVMRELRSCYDHLAGRLAVELRGRLLDDAGLLAGDARLTPQGKSLLERIGIDLSAIASKPRTFCRACLDWSERQPHVAGAVGAAIMSQFLELGWIRPRQNGRALILTATGERGIEGVFGISASRERTAAAGEWNGIRS
jgi:DNA-binding transcriptional ArsR family regulator